MMRVSQWPDNFFQFSKRVPLVNDNYIYYFYFSNFMSIVMSSFALNEHYHSKLRAYMNEMELYNIKGKKLSQRSVCMMIIMDFLDEVESNKELLHSQSFINPEQDPK